ncbi:MAG: hypothetical protein LCH37_01925 [Bacteroidetes bacterium]|nr:hypothetical protein [Bacteroidota bacterium]
MPSPYNYHFDDKAQSYVFSTENGVQYSVAFFLDQSLFALSNIQFSDVYQVVIEKVTPEREPLDNRVSATICDILSKFFQNSKNTILFICDDVDGRAYSRFRKFNSWYAQSELTSSIIKIDKVFVNENIAGSAKVYSSLIYHVDNDDKDVILDVYDSIEQILNEKN